MVFDAKASSEEIYTYAGFRYHVLKNANGEAIRMLPVSGQHEAARKDKHCHNALQMYLDEQPLGITKKNKEQP